MSFIRLQLQRRGALRWASPQQMMEVLSLAIEQARLPVARRSGKQLRFDIRLAPAAPPWCCTVCEYADLALEAPASAAAVMAALAAALPDGLAVVWAQRLSASQPGIAAAVREQAFAFYGQFDPARTAAFAAAAEFPFRRVKKDRERVYDLKTCVTRLDCGPDRIEISLKTLEEGVVRPHEAVSAIFGMPWEEAVMRPCERTSMILARVPLLPPYMEMV